MGESFEFGLDVIRETMLEIVLALLPGEEVFINFTDREEQTWLESKLTPQQWARIRCFDVPFREPYLRDNGPVFVLKNDDRDLLGIDWFFDGWSGKYPPHDLDNSTAGKMAEAAGFPIEESGLTFEGGAIDSNGQGTILISEPCFFSRNTGLTKAEAEQKLHHLLGANTFHWLPCPSIPGDDTEGHVDVSTRFCAPETIIVSRIRGYTDIVKALGYQTIELPQPNSCWHEIRRIDTPASYANFYIGNEVVLVPVFGQRTDDEACEIISSAFPGRTIVPINAYEIVKGQGGIHCLTQTVPLAGNGGIR